jgi:hypothetical protein
MTSVPILWSRNRHDQNVRGWSGLSLVLAARAQKTN